MKKIVWFLGLVVVLLAVLLAAAPASWVLYHAQQAVPGLQVSGVSGSAWRGQMSGVEVRSRGNSVALGNVNWQLEWPTLFSLRPCVLFSTTHHQQTSRGEACVDPFSQQLDLNETYVTIPASLIATLFGVEVRGEFDGVIQLLSFQQQKLEQLDLDVIWKNAAFNNSEAWLPLGELLITVEDDQQGGVIARWSDNTIDGQSGPLSIDLTTELSANQAIAISGFIAPRASASRSMHQTLDLIAQRGKDNRYRLDVKL